MVDPKKRGEKASGYQASKKKKKRTISKSHLLFQLETLHLVLVLKRSLLDLDAFETLETALDFDGQGFDVAGALSKEAGEPTVDETGESTFKVGGIEAILFGFVAFLGDVWDGGTRETCGDWRMLEGSVLGGGRGEIWPLVDWEAGRHLNGNERCGRWG